MKLSRDVAHIEILLSPAANLREPRVRHETRLWGYQVTPRVRPAFGVPPSRGQQEHYGHPGPSSNQGFRPARRPVATVTKPPDLRRRTVLPSLRGPDQGRRRAFRADSLDNDHTTGRIPPVPATRRPCLAPCTSIVTIRG